MSCAIPPQYDKIDPKLKDYLVELSLKLIRNYYYKAINNELYRLDPAWAIRRFQERDFNLFIISISKVSYVKEYIPESIREREAQSFLIDLTKKVSSMDTDSWLLSVPTPSDLTHAEFVSSFTTALTRDTVERKIDDFLRNLKNRIQEFEVVAALENVSLEGTDQISIGDFIILSPSAAERKLREYPFERIIFNKEAILQDFKDKVCICVSLTSDLDNIHDKALIKIEYRINILRLYIPLMAHRDSIRIGLVGTILASRVNLLSFRKDGGHGAAGIRKGFNTKYILTNEFITSMRTVYGLDEIEKILLKDPPISNFEKQILLAIRWIGMGLHDEIRSDRFIKLMIALEALILVDGDPKSESIAERSAYILGYDQNSRQETYDKMKRCYDIRSEIVHEGIYDIDDERLQGLTWMTIEILRKLILMRSLISKVEDLSVWVNLQKNQSRFK